MGWAVAILVFVVGGGAWLWWRRRLLQALDCLEEALEDLVAGQELHTSRMREAPETRRMAEKLEQLADEQDHLRRQRHLGEANLQIILSGMEEAVMVVDSRRAIRVVNPSFQRMFGLAGNPFNQTVRETLREVEFDEMVSAALESREAQTREVVMPGDNGKPRLIATSAAPVRSATGELGVVAMFRDVTRLKQLEEVRKEFVANVSHELRTPLSIFHGYLENLIEHPDLPRDELAAILKVLRKHSLRLNALVEDLLILARLESRNDKLDRAPVELPALLNGLVVDWRMKIAEKRIDLRLDLAAGLPVIMADAFRLEQVLNNLIENAVKYTEPGGCVCIHASYADRVVELRVSDTGVGIPEAALPHIFERFYRADKARSRALGGTGLGLSIVKHIVQLHGGTVAAESTVGKGTTVIIRLPAHTGSAAEPVELGELSGDAA